uniref:Uncharacterized protein n=1 Tax=Caenorhabditis japonica TaxID=281687 RepID=A0A8R1EAR5_CAEJA
MHHNNCTNNATSITQHAQCVVITLNRLHDQRRKLRKYKKLKFRRSRFRRSALEYGPLDNEFKVQQRKSYELKEKSDVISPLSNIAKQLIQLVREKKNKKTNGPTKK